METLILSPLIFVCWIIVSAINARAEIVTLFRSVRDSLCTNCAYAHIARGFEARKQLTFCTYAGVPREVQFAVSDCSMFCSRNANAAPDLVRVIGFAEHTSGEPSIPSVVAKGD